MEWRRQNQANLLLTLASEGSFPSCSGAAIIRSIQALRAPAAASLDGHIVRSFSIQNGLPPLATRKCAIKGERRDKAATVIAEAAIAGAAAAKSTRPAARSMVSGKEKAFETPDRVRSARSRGSRLMVDTARNAPDFRGPNRSIRAVLSHTKGSTICLHIFYR